MTQHRFAEEFVFNWADGQTLSEAHLVTGGAFGTVIVPAGSDLIGKALQFVAHSPSGKYSDADLLSTPLTLVAGSNPLIGDAIAEAGAVGHLKLKVDSAVSGAQSAVLLWKS